MTLAFAGLLAATFVIPGHRQEGSPAERDGAQVKGGGRGNKTTETPVVSESELDERARGFLRAFVDKGNAFGGSASLKVLFATVADPVETHLAAAFDHNVAALQDAAQDSGFLFDGSWIVWDLQRTYESIDDEVKAERQHRLKHRYPGILLFRRDTATALDNPYTCGLVVFLLAEKPTAGINIEQAQKALQLVTPVAPQSPFTLAEDAALIAGPAYSGSLHSLVPLVRVLKDAQKTPPLGRVLIRSAGFTDSDEASAIAQSIAHQFEVDVDIGSAEHPLASWTDTALQTLQNYGIERRRVAVISEGESLFGATAENTSPVSQQAAGAPSQEGPWHLQFPRDISALRATYENQGVLDNAPTSEISGRLHLKAEEARSADSIRTFGADDTVAAQESVLLGISEFIRSHGIHAVIIVASSEQDSYFLTRFFHANNNGVRVVIVGATRLFMRGATAQFRGDMMVSSFPLLPRLYDWTELKGSLLAQPAAKDPKQAGSSAQGQALATGQTLAQDQTQHIFPNDSSAGEYLAVRDLLWDAGTKQLPREYSRPDWTTNGNIAFKPPVYVTVLGAGGTWPTAVFDSPEGFKAASEDKASAAPNGKTSAPTAPPAKKNGSKDAYSQPTHKWLVTMPFHFGNHLEASGSNGAAPKISAEPPKVNASGFWKLMFYICVIIPFTYCIGISYADPVRKRSFAYLQPPVHWQHWVLLATVPALLCQVSFLPLAREMTFPPGVLGDHSMWCFRALFAGIAFPLLIVANCLMQGFRVGCFGGGADPEYRAKSLMVLGATIAALIVVPLIFLVYNGVEDFSLTDFMHAYREMHWDSGLSLLPTLELLILAVSIWNYEALIGISVLRQRPRLPILPDDDRISDKAAARITEAGRYLPSGHGARGFWIGYAATSAAIVFSLLNWPSFRFITSFSSRPVTVWLLVLAGVAFLLMLMDILQFAWLWSELHELLLVLNRHSFKRSFIPLRDFNWSSIWSFSGGSFKEKRKVLAALVECASELHAQSQDLVSDEEETILCSLRQGYARLDAGAERYEKRLHGYRGDLKKVHKTLADIASKIASKYGDQIREAGTITSASQGPTADDPFRDEERELEQLPAWLLLWERFLCLLYIAFIRVIIGRLRTLAISIVSVFSLVALALAVYPFQPILPLFAVGAATLLAIAGVMFVVFSQMDKDPVLARILQSNPNKLEWSFYGKFLDTLALPLLTLLSGLLPGGAGRLIDLLRTAFSHAQ